jgi:hypothetical protein
MLIAAYTTAEDEAESPSFRDAAALIACIDNAARRFRRHLKSRLRQPIALLSKFAVKGDRRRDPRHKSARFRYEIVVAREGLEPPTRGLGNRCSIL